MAPYLLDEEEEQQQLLPDPSLQPPTQVEPTPDLHSQLGQLEQQRDQIRKLEQKRLQPERRGYQEKLQMMREEQAAIAAFEQDDFRLDDILDANPSSVAVDSKYDAQTRWAAAVRANKELYEQASWGEYVAKKATPVVRDVVAAKELSEGMMAALRIRDGKAKRNDYMLAARSTGEAAARGDWSTTQKFGDAVLGLVPLFAELGLTGGVYTVTKGAAVKGLTKGAKEVTKAVAEGATKKAVEMSLKKKLGAHAAGAVAGGAAIAVVNPQTVVKYNVEKGLTDVLLSDKFQVSLATNGEINDVAKSNDHKGEFLTAFMHNFPSAFGKSAAELGSEMMGGDLAKVGGLMMSSALVKKLSASPLGRSFLNASDSTKDWMLSKPILNHLARKGDGSPLRQQLMDVSERIGLHGIVGELSEEMLNDVLGMTSVAAEKVTGAPIGFGEGELGGGTTGKGLKAMGTLDPEMAAEAAKEMIFMAAVLSVPMAVRGGVGAALDVAHDTRQEELFRMADEYRTATNDEGAGNEEAVAEIVKTFSSDEGKGSDIGEVPRWRQAESVSGTPLPKLPKRQRAMFAQALFALEQRDASVNESFAAGKVVNAKVVEESGIPVPEGWTIVGDNYAPPGTAEAVGEPPVAPEAPVTGVPEEITPEVEETILPEEVVPVAEEPTVEEAPGFAQHHADEEAGNVLVELDVTSVDSQLPDDQRIGAGGEGSIVDPTGTSRYDRFAAWDRGERTPGRGEEGIPGRGVAEDIEAPTMGINPGGQLVFDNGRHRFAVLRDQGKRVFASMSPQDAATARDKGLVVSRSTQEPAPVVEEPAAPASEDPDVNDLASRIAAGEKLTGARDVAKYTLLKEEVDAQVEEYRAVHQPGPQPFPREQKRAPGPPVNKAVIDRLTEMLPFATAKTTQYAEKEGVRVDLGGDRWITIENTDDMEIDINRVRELYPESDVTDEDIRKAEILGAWLINKGDGTTDSGLGILKLKRDLDREGAEEMEVTLWHELVHTARSLGLWTDNQWKSLEDKYVDKKIHDTDLRQEEAIADGVGATMVQRKNLIRRIKKFLRKILASILPGRYSEPSADLAEELLTERSFWQRKDGARADDTGLRYSVKFRSSAASDQKLLEANARYMELAQDEEANAEELQRMVDAIAERVGYKPDQPLLHGTTHRFTVFDKNAPNIDNNLGKGFYFTNSQVDAATNYAGEGTDLTGRIERLSEQLIDDDSLRDEFEEQEDAPGGITDLGEFAENMARQQLSGGEERIIKAYVKLDNPAVIGGEKETRLELTEEMDDEGEVIGEPTGSLVDFTEALRKESWGYDDINVDEAISELMEGAEYSDIGLGEAIKILEGGGMAYAVEQDTGELAVNEIIRQSLENMGFDGIIDGTVDAKFGTSAFVGGPYGKAKIGGMVGVAPDTVHVIAFHPEQIKSSDPVTRDDDGNIIPLSERFQPEEEDIRYSIRLPGEPRRGDERRDNFRKWFGDSKVVDEDGEPRVVYHGTTSEFAEFDNPYAEDVSGDWHMFSESPEYAGEFAEGRRGNIIPAYIKAERPLDLRELPARRGDVRVKLLKTLEEKGFDIEKLQDVIPYERDLFQHIHRKGAREELARQMKELGFDSIVMPDSKAIVVDNQMQHIESDTWVVLNPTQIKSATGNIGTFDPTDPDIRYSLKFPGHGRRGPFGNKRGERRAVATKVPAEGRERSPVAISDEQVVKDLRDIWDIPIVTGKFSVDERTAAYEAYVNTIYANERFAFNISAVLHEMGIALDANTDVWSPKEMDNSDEVNEELMALSWDESREGGLAEFFRQVVMGDSPVPGRIERKAYQDAQKKKARIQKSIDKMLSKPEGLTAKQERALEKKYSDLDEQDTIIEEQGDIFTRDIQARAPQAFKHFNKWMEGNNEQRKKVGDAQRVVRDYSEQWDNMRVRADRYKPGKDDEEKGTWDEWTSWHVWEPYLEWYYRMYVDKLHFPVHLEKLMRRAGLKIGGEGEPAALSDIIRYWYGKEAQHAMDAFENGVRDPLADAEDRVLYPITTDATEVAGGHGLPRALHRLDMDNIEEDKERLFDFMHAQHAYEMSVKKPGFWTGMSADQAQGILKTYGMRGELHRINGKETGRVQFEFIEGRGTKEARADAVRYGEIARMLRAYAMNLQKLKRKYGVISLRDLKNMSNTHEYYYPLNKENKGHKFLDRHVKKLDKMMKTGPGKYTFYRTSTGSDQKHVDPIVSLMMKTHDTYKAVAEHHKAKTMMTLMHPGLQHKSPLPRGAVDTEGILDFFRPKDPATSAGMSLEKLEKELKGLVEGGVLSEDEQTEIYHATVLRDSVRKGQPEGVSDDAKEAIKKLAVIFDKKAKGRDFIKKPLSVDARRWDQLRRQMIDTAGARGVQDAYSLISTQRPTTLPRKAVLDEQDYIRYGMNIDGTRYEALVDPRLIEALHSSPMIPEHWAYRSIAMMTHWRKGGAVYLNPSFAVMDWFRNPIQYALGSRERSPFNALGAAYWWTVAMTDHNLKSKPGQPYNEVIAQFYRDSGKISAFYGELSRNEIKLNNSLNRMILKSKDPVVGFDHFARRAKELGFSEVSMNNIIAPLKKLKDENARHAWVASFDNAKSFITMSDSVARVAEYYAVLQRHGFEMRKQDDGTRKLMTLEDGGWVLAQPSSEVRIEAALAANEAVLDFLKQGQWGEHMNKVSMFWSAGVNASDKLMRIHVESLAKTDLPGSGFSRMLTDKRRDPKRLMEFYLAGMSMSLIYWAMVHDEDWYVELPAHVKNMYWVIALPWGDYLYIAKGYDAGHVFNSVEGALNAMATEDKRAFEEMIWHTLDKNFHITPVHMLKPSTIPGRAADLLSSITVAGPGVEVIADWDFFRQSSIEGSRLKDREARHRSKPSTLLVSKLIAQATGHPSWEQFAVSPVKFEHAANQWTGGMYKRYAKLVDIAAGDRPLSWRDVPGMYSLYRDRDSSRSLQYFYDKQWYKVKQAHASAKHGFIPMTSTLNDSYQINYRYSRILSAIFREIEGIRNPKESREAGGKYAIGIAREATGEAPLEKFPTIWKGKVPPGIEKVRDKTLGTLIRNSTAPLLNRQDRKAGGPSLAEWQKKAEDRKSSIRTAIRFMRRTGLSRAEIERRMRDMGRDKDIYIDRLRSNWARYGGG